jgi:PAS domain S-box-containing protein
VHPEDREHLKKAMTKQITGEYDEEYRIVRPDGSQRWIREKAFPIHDEEGNLHRICGVSEDFTQRKEAEEALLRERNFISAVLDTAGALVVVLDQHGKIVRFNKACERISGYTFEEVEGRKFWDFLLLPEEMDTVKERWNHLLAGEFPNYGENYWVTKSGDKRLISWSNTSLMHDCRTVDFVVAIGIDITEAREAEENLKLYKKIFMTTNDAIAIIDKEGKVFARNPAHVKYTGYSDAEIIGKSITSVTSEKVTRRIGASMKKHGHFRGEIDFRSKDKSEYQVDMSIFPIEGDEGEPAYYVGMGRDITERKKAQEALATRLRYEEGLAGCSQAMLEEDSIAEDIQEALEHLLAAADVGRVYFYENFEDPTFGLCMRQKHEACAPGVKPEIDNPLLQNLPYKSGFEHWAEKLSKGQPYFGITRNFPKAENMILEERGILSIIVLPVFVNGEWYGLIGFDDVEQEREWGEEEIRLLRTAAEIIGGYLSRRLAVEALRVSEERFRGLVENANDIIYSMNPEGEFTYLSPQFEVSTGFKVEDWLGKRPLDLIHEPDHDVYNAWLAQATCPVPEEHQEGYTFQVLDNHGHLRWFVTQASIVRDEQGNVLEITGVSHDITEIKQALADLEEANQNLKETQTQLIQSEKMASLGMLVAGIAHEINTPIGAVNSMHNTLVRGVEKLKKTLKVICKEEDLLKQDLVKTLKIIEDANRIIDSGTERVTNIVRKLRSFARLDEAELKDANIHEGLDDTLTLVHHELKHNITVHRNYGDIPPIACYPGQLNQVFMNLLINAKQAIENKGEITITTFERRKKVYVEISDTGTGIPKENLDKIFDPGFTTKGVGVGTGLGLSICYQIIQDHHGKIQVKSEVGKGTTFTIILPTNLISNNNENN